MSTSTSKKLSLHLLVDSHHNKVVFAESNNEFIDILFSFLTLPLGTIIRLLSKKSSLSCIDNLYESVENIPDHFFQTPACKAMLLCPRNASGIQCGRLPVRPDDLEHRIYYRCASRLRSCKISSFSGVKCSCGKSTDVPFAVSPGSDGGEGADEVFVKGTTSFMISDDLEVNPVSMGASLVLLNKLGIEDGSVLERRTVELGRAEILNLLKRSLVSFTPLTDVFLEERDTITDTDKSVMREPIHAIERHQKMITESKRISVKVYLIKDSDRMVYAEAGEDFIDLLFSFLTFPLGSIVKILEKHSSLGCIDNLYKSVEILSSGDSYIKSENHRDMLLDPKMAPYFRCSNQLLRVDELVSEMDSRELNPKMKDSETYYGGGYAKGMVAYMVTDEMVVAPLSPISGVSIINKLMVPISSLEEAEASIGEAEALDLLRACLVSPTPLSDIFSPALVNLLQRQWWGDSLRN